MDIRLVEVRVQTSELKRLLIIKSLHKNNNDYYHIWKIQFAGSTNMKETTFQYWYIKAQLRGQYSGFQIYSGHLEF